MTLPQTLYESPTGLVHMCGLLSNGRAITNCGREVNTDTWTRITMLDEWMWGKGKRTVRDKIELPKCDKCFG